MLKLYKESKGKYGAAKLHILLLRAGFKLSLKTTQRLMSQLGLKSIIVKKFKSASTKKPIAGLEKVLNRDFTTSNINEKWLGI